MEGPGERVIWSAACFASAMFCEASPGPAKYGLSLLGKCANELRLPLCEISERAQAQVRDAMVGLGLLIDKAAE